jgi:hypothetical protein
MRDPREIEDPAVSSGFDVRCGNQQKDIMRGDAQRAVATCRHCFPKSLLFYNPRTKNARRVDAYHPYRHFSSKLSCTREQKVKRVNNAEIYIKLLRKKVSTQWSSVHSGVTRKDEPSSVVPAPADARKMRASDRLSSKCFSRSYSVLLTVDLQGRFAIAHFG